MEEIGVYSIGMSKHPATPDSALRQARQRILLQRTFAIFVRLGLAWWTLVVVVATVIRFASGHLPAPGYWWGSVALYLVGWVAWTAAVFPGLMDAARWLDQSASFKDRFVTTLEFESIPARNSWHESAIRQNAGEIARLDINRCCPVRIPRQSIWLVLPMVCLVNLWIYDLLSRPAIVRDPEVEQMLEVKSRELERLSEQIRKEAETRKIDELRKLAEEMKKSAELIKPQEGKSAEEMKKDALLEWSRLESRLGELARQGPGANSAEMKQLAEALEQDPATAGLAQMLKNENLAGAAQALQSMMEQAENDPDAAQQLREMAQRMGQSQMSSEQMSEMMKQMRQAAGGNQSQQQQQQLQKAAQNFSQMLSNMNKSRQQSQMAQSGLSAMQMMKSSMSGLGMPKSGMGQGEKGDAPGKSEGLGSTNPEQKEGMGIGSDTADKIFGERKNIDAQRSAVKVEGQMGDGQSFENVLRGTAEASGSTVEYREMFNNYTPEAEEAIFKENIPLGSKYYIKRYFESIRPQQ